MDTPPRRRYISALASLPAVLRRDRVFVGGRRGRAGPSFTGICTAIFLAAAASAAEPQRPTPLKSGIEFASADIRALQADDFANPGMLWVVRGEKLWRGAPGGGAPP